MDGRPREVVFARRKRLSQLERTWRSLQKECGGRGKSDLVLPEPLRAVCRVKIRQKTVHDSANARSESNRVFVVLVSGLGIGTRGM
jgi:hypothetical protein